MQKEELQCGKRDKNNDVSPFEKKKKQNSNRNIIA